MSTAAVPPSPDELARCEELVESWLAQQVDQNPTVASVERDLESGERRWVARVLGEEKTTSAVWFHLRQRTLHAETYFMPAPEEQPAELYEHLLRRNLGLWGLRFAVGAEDAVFLVTEVPVEWVDADELDRVLGSIYAAVEQCFRPAMRIGFASRFTG